MQTGRAGLEQGGASPEGGIAEFFRFSVVLRSSVHGGLRLGSFGGGGAMPSTVFRYNIIAAEKPALELPVYTGLPFDLRMRLSPLW
jgi:hypothetical protein